MEIKKVEDKFFVLKSMDLINFDKEYLDTTPFNEVLRDIDHIRKAEGKRSISENKYIVCNQDEPYASLVWNIILWGECRKEESFGGSCSFCETVKKRQKQKDWRDAEREKRLGRG